VDSVDAAEAGIQYEVNQINNQVVAGSTSFVCPTKTTLPSTGGFTTSYSLSYASIQGQATPTAALTPCTGATVSLQGGYTYLLQATGTTTAGVVGARTEQAQVYVPSGVTYGKTGTYTDALYAGVDVLGGGSFKLSGGDTYSGMIGLCTSNWAFGGNYFSDGIPLPSSLLSLTVPTTFAGACNVSGNLYMNNSLGIAITSGSGVGGSVYSAGPVSLSGGAGVGQSLYADGAVSISGGGTVGGNVYSGDSLLGVTLSGGPVVTGNVYSAGPVTITGTVDGNIYANGPVTLSSATVKGNIYTTGTVTLNSGTYNGIYSNGLVSVNGYPTVSGTVYSNGGFYDGGGTFGNNVEVNGGIVTYLASQAGTLYAAPGTVITPYLFYLGPATTIHSLPAGYPLPYVPTVSSTTIAATVNTAMVAAANATNGTTTGTTTAVTMPTLAFDQNAWIANSSFCGSATCTASNINFVTNNDCNIPSSSNANALDPSSVWAVIKGMETAGAKPTVIQTDCQFTWGDSPLKGYALPLEANLAIFDSAGFTFPSSFSGISSGDGNSHQFYAIVPSASYNVLPAILNSLFGTASYPVGEASCTLLTGPDINISAPLTDSGDKIQDFLYTPANVCSYTGNATIYGRVYAGQMVSANSNWNQTFYDISPYGVVTNNGNQGNGGAAGAAGTPVLQWVRQVAAAST
jgi:cytoskeletal protein CcmA (bactofilin family)